MINSLAGFALAASIGIGAIIGSLITMSWVERKMLGSGVPRRETARGRHRETGRLVAEYRQQRAAPGGRPRRNALAAAFAVVLAVLRTSAEAVRGRAAAPAGGPGAMRRPGPRHSFDRPTGPGSRRSRILAKQRS
ncbi:hypothetical protein [Saccharopolyspora elongata]|uniref:Uncharacterized protein n=1 Tax=Saccharopolyspora elongata TaxID=2530387 RepID=A0A4R4ZAR8_9PSEU|nr:hypothetical protein [Saccharopolyspora elongata]TDD53342.1 hypothetical protein E1288_09495 [Saccharopolyspora elongata]